jgi:hypothetical protein
MVLDIVSTFAVSALDSIKVILASCLPESRHYRIAPSSRICPFLKNGFSRTALSQRLEYQVAALVKNPSRAEHVAGYYRRNAV